jgi:methylated-DNA-protein-cysteine methyltransferase-like protein
MVPGQGIDAAMAVETNKSYARIWNVVAAIPRGRVASYGQVAELAGIGRGARLVGWALGQAPDRSALPWHRVLNAQGRISIPPGSRGRAEQIRRLTAEGVVVNEGRVDMRRYRWDPDLDELVWGPAVFSAPAGGPTGRENLT